MKGEPIGKENQHTVQPALLLSCYNLVGPVCRGGARTVLPWATMQFDFTFSDCIALMTQMVRPGPKLSRAILHWMPWFDPAEQQSWCRRALAIGRAMTEWERDHADKLNASRRRRIAAGAGVTIIDVSRLLRQFEMTRKMMLQPGQSTCSAKDAVLGLVTNNPSRRDPSFALPDADRALRRGPRIFWAVVLCALMLMYVFFRNR